MLKVLFSFDKIITVFAGRGELNKLLMSSLPAVSDKTPVNPKGLNVFFALKVITEMEIFV